MSDIKLAKRDERISLRKMLSYKEAAYFALTWNTRRYGGKRDFDLDLSMVCLDEDGVCRDDRYFLWWGHKISPNGALQHSGDNKVGISGNSGDDAETIKIVLSKLPDWVRSVVPFVTIYDHQSDQHFGVVDNAYVRIMDSSREEKVRFMLSEEERVAKDTSLIFGKLERSGDEEWEFHAVEEGSSMELEDYVEMYGMNLRDLAQKYAPWCLK